MLLNVIEKGQTAIAERKPSERFFLILWLLGPFILLIERSPADIWLTSLSLAFVFRTIVYRDASWLKHLWVRAAFAFWGICLLSAVAYQLSANFVSEAFIWFRFPLFAMATAFWLGADKRLLYLMIFSTSLALLLMCGILIAEIAIEGFKPRLSWPFDDLVPGNYLAKVGLPVVVFASALFLSSNGRTSLLLGSYCVLILVMALLTGERINFLILLCAALLTIFIWEPSWKKRVAVFFAGAFVLLTIFTLSPSVLQRFVFDFLTALPLHPDSVYYQAMVPAWLIFEQFPILGIGPGNFRYFCADLVAPNLGLQCHNHPHNFYLQILSETGLLGGIAAIVFIFLIIFQCVRAGFGQRNVLLITAWVIPFALFWPIRSSADFFGQWNNIFLWSAVALALAVSHSKSTISQ